jgi:hypothetical protein
MAAIAALTALSTGVQPAQAASSTGVVLDGAALAVGVAHCEEEYVSRNGARTAQLTGVLTVTGAVASVSITCVIKQAGSIPLSTSLSVPGDVAIAPTKTGTLTNSSFLVCGYGHYQPILTTTPVTVKFQNPDGC